MSRANSLVDLTMKSSSSTTVAETYIMTLYNRLSGDRVRQILKKRPELLIMNTQRKCLDIEILTSSHMPCILRGVNLIILKTLDIFNMILGLLGVNPKQEMSLKRLGRRYYWECVVLYFHNRMFDSVKHL